MEIWDGYLRNGTLANIDLVRGRTIPNGIYHLVCEAIIQHVDGEYLLMQRSFNKEIFPGKWEIGAGGSALKGENKFEAVLREIKEETGIVDGEIREIYYLPYEKHQSIYCGFLCITSCDKDDIQLQENETIDYKWIKKEELIHYFDSPQYSLTSKERMKGYIDSIR